MSDPDFPWTGIILGAPILGVWYWCTDQYIVQRVLSAKGLNDARLGPIFAGYLKLLPLFIFVIPGVVAYCLSQSGRLELDDSNEALPVLIGTLLPAGVRGLILAGFFAALMSSLSSAFNSCSTLITLDIYKKLRPEASERRLVVVGQVSTILIVILGLLWIPFMKDVSQQLYVYLQSVQAYISPPIASVFLLGIFWKRVNARGAMTALLLGFALGAARLVAELNQASFAEGSALWRLATMNFLHFAVALFVVCTITLILVSLTGRPHSDEQLAGLTFQTTERETAPEPREKRQRTIAIVASIGVLAGVAATWLYFI